MSHVASNDFLLIISVPGLLEAYVKCHRQTACSSVVVRLKMFGMPRSYWCIMCVTMYGHCMCSSRCARIFVSACFRATASHSHGHQDLSSAAGWRSCLRESQGAFAERRGFAAPGAALRVSTAHMCFCMFYIVHIITSVALHAFVCVPTGTRASSSKALSLQIYISQPRVAAKLHTAGRFAPVVWWQRSRCL